MNKKMIGTIAWGIIGFAIIGGSLFLGFSLNLEESQVKKI